MLEMVPDKHAHRETKMFLRFAEVCPLPIRHHSIRKCNPPLPDIECEIEGEGHVAFELVEAIEPKLARRESNRVKLEALLESEYRKLPDHERSEIDRKLGDARVGVKFHMESSLRAQRKTVPLILEKIQEAISDLEGDVRLDENSRLDGVVQKITIYRSNLTGPIFKIQGGGSFADPVVKRIHEKFEKKYDSSVPVELLAYYERQPVLSDSFWLPELRTYMEKELRNSPFRRVWVFDGWNKALKFYYPTER